MTEMEMKMEMEMEIRKHKVDGVMERFWGERGKMDEERWKREEGGNRGGWDG